MLDASEHAREAHWLAQWRAQFVRPDGGMGVSRAELAQMVRTYDTGCSERLIEILELGGVTHPAIADRIARVTGANMRQRDSLVHKRHRKARRQRDAQTEGDGSRRKPFTQGEAAVNAHEVVQIAPDGSVIARFESQTAAALATGLSVAAVSCRCRHVALKRAGEFDRFGYSFRFAKDMEADR